MSRNKPRTLLRAGALVLGALASACTDVALKAINSPSYVFSDLELKRDLAYGERDYQRLDLYLPAGAVEPRRQLVIFIYGGGWTSGSRGNYYFVADALTSAGYAVAIPDYIKYPEGAFPTFVEDIAQAIDWLSRHAREFTDIDELILMGHSAGAHTAALLITDPAYLGAHGLRPESIAAFVGLAGPYGFTPEKKKYRNIFANLQDFNQMRPLHLVTGREPPALLLHGSDDTTVLPINTRKFANKINAEGGSAMTRFYADSGHVGLVLALSRLAGGNGTVRRDIFDFLQRELPGSGAASR